MDRPRVNAKRFPSRDQLNRIMSSPDKPSTLCGSPCLRRRRIDISAAFFIEQEFQASGLFIYDLYAGMLRRKPFFDEYAADRGQVVGGPNLEAQKAAFAIEFVQRPEFVNKHEAHVTAETFVNALIEQLNAAGVDLSGERSNLINIYEQGDSRSTSRARVVGVIADNALFKQTQYNRAFVLMEYFGYLRRDPDQTGYNFWLNVLDHGDNYRGMVCSFITSAEYQRRFSTVVTHSNSECSQ